MIPQVGQKLFLAYTEPRMRDREHEVIVTRVGRKWAYIYRADTAPDQRHPHLERRFDMTDPRWFVCECGFSFNARVWPSREAWQREKTRDEAYIALRRSIDYSALGPDVTEENVREAARALGLGARFEAHLKQGQ